MKEESKSSPVIGETKEEVRNKMIALLDWYNNLSPANRVSVWSKNGEYSGIFTMDSEQLVDKFLSIKSKEK